MRRAEMARRRKNLSEKRNEEEKVCNIFVQTALEHPELLLSCPDYHLLITKSNHSMMSQTKNNGIC